jgi:hypothetical protein
MMPWDIARAQSNLRVATTASPISAGGDGHAGAPSAEDKKHAKKLVALLRGGVDSNF